MRESLLRGKYQNNLFYKSTITLCTPISIFTVSVLINSQDSLKNVFLASFVKNVSAYKEPRGK